MIAGPQILSAIFLATSEESLLRGGAPSDTQSIFAKLPLLPRMRSSRVQNKLRRLEEQMQKMNSKIDSMTEVFEARRADDEAAAIAAGRIRSGAARHKEDGVEALAKLGIKLP